MIALVISTRETMKRAYEKPVLVAAGSLARATARCNGACNGLSGDFPDE
jgi:hypothetical protein